MKAMVSSLIVLATVIFLTMGASAKGHRSMTLVGKIVAVRPGERLMEMPSLIMNKEALIAIAGSSHDKGRRQVIKVEYRHYGYTDLTNDILEGSPLLSMKVRRERSCDQSYSDYVNSSLLIRDADSSKALTQPVLFFDSFSDKTIAADKRLKCYVLEKDDFQIVKAPEPR